MTDPIIALESSQLTVEPGGQAQTMLTIKNLGTIVEGFRLQVLGEGAQEWGEVNPPEVQVYPEQEATAVVVFAPPPGAQIPSGTFPFGVRAESVVNPQTSAVAEGDLVIGRVFGLQSKITPVASSGRWRGSHFIEITNWGNAPIRLKLTASDPDERLAFLLGPEILELPLGVTGHARLRVKTRKPFLRGTPTRLPFQVVAEPDPPEEQVGPPSPIPNPRRAVLDGAFNQRPILSKLVVAVAVIGVLALAGGIAWALTRPAAPAGSELATGAPVTPELAAVAVDGESIQLIWNRQPNLTNLRIHQQTPDGRTTGVQAVDGALDAFTVAGLTAQTDYCFQLEAVRDDQVSPLSARQCATTLTAAVSASASVSGSAAPTAGSAPESGTPPTEQSAGPSAGGSPSSQLAGGGGETGVSGAPGEPGSGGAGGSQGQGGSTGASAGQTGGGPASGQAGSGSFGPNQYINVVFTIPAADTQAQQRAEARRQALATAGIPAAVLHTPDFPDLRLTQGSTGPADAYLVYVGPFESLEEARAFCDSQPTLAATCISARPNPGS